MGRVSSFCKICATRIRAADLPKRRRDGILPIALCGCCRSARLDEIRRGGVVRVGDAPPVRVYTAKELAAFAAARGMKVSTLSSSERAKTETAPEDRTRTAGARRRAARVPTQRWRLA